MDETPVFFDIPSRYTIVKRGTKRVTQRATNKEKKRITVVLACCSNGEKLDPMVILHSNDRGGIHEEGVYHNKTAWMTGDLMEEWLQLNSTRLQDSHV